MPLEFQRRDPAKMRVYDNAAFQNQTIGPSLGPFLQRSISKKLIPSLEIELKEGKTGLAVKQKDCPQFKRDEGS